MSKLDFFLIHLMAHPAPLTRRYLDELIAGERFGYDGLWIFEDGRGEVPAHTPTATRVAACTQRIPIGLVGDAPPLYGDPLRVAEEIAMLDVGSGGRAIAGFVRGTGTEQDANGSKRSYSQERFWEMHDLIVRAWTAPGPFRWQGRHYELPHVNPWPRPRQRPHPPVWLAGTCSFETIEKAAERRYTFMTTFAPQWLTRASFDMYRRAAEKLGYEPSPKQLATVVPTYVAETEDQAHREARPHLTRLFENPLRDYRELTYEELLDERYVFRAPGGKPSWSDESPAGAPTPEGRAALPGRSHRPVVRPNPGFREARGERVAKPAGRSPAVASFTGTGLARRCGGSCA